MFKGMFGRKRTTSRPDVIMAVAGALYAVWKASDTYREYKQDQEEKELNK